MSLFSQDYEAKLLEQNLTAFNRFFGSLPET
ncbi:putative DNA-binding phage protein [Streptococcus pyogenes]|nr:putative DNA-binding phage protein [Streptococcus pyogenes]